jgi:hypothetical protein
MPHFDPANFLGLTKDPAHRDPWVVRDNHWTGYEGPRFTCADNSGFFPATVNCRGPLPYEIVRDTAAAGALNQFGTPVALSSLDPPPDFISVRAVGQLGSLGGYADGCQITDGVPTGCNNKPPLVDLLTAAALGSAGQVGHYVPSGTELSTSLSGNLSRDDGTPLYTGDPDNTASVLLFTPAEITTLRILLDARLGAISDTTQFEFRITPWWLTEPPFEGFMCVL